MTDLSDLNEAYFQSLCVDAFDSKHSRQMYEGLSREMYDIPFYWTMWPDENRAGDALSFRQSEFLNLRDSREIDGMDQILLGQWAVAAPSVFEVLLGMAKRWEFYFESPACHFFAIMVTNLGFHVHPGKELPTAAKERIRNVLDNWMSRQFEPNGEGSPFPVLVDSVDLRRLNIWEQMNAYSAEHFQ